MKFREEEHIVKLCNRCKQLKLSTEFYDRKLDRGKLRGVCKACEAKAKTERQEKVTTRECIKARNLVGIRPQRRWTIEQCMLLLGAPENEVKFNTRRGWHSLHYNSVRGAHPIKLLDHMGGGEILYWATNLYKDFLSRHHPDKHSEDLDFYDNKCRQASEAFTRLRRILKHHGAVEA